MTTSAEMTSVSSYSPLDSPPQQQSPPPQRNVTFWDLFIAAAKSQYGDFIEVIDNPVARNALSSINFEISIISSDPRPTEVSRAVVDIITKEFKNSCENEADETLIKVVKSNAGWTGGRFHFSTARGGYDGIGGDIGPQVIHLAITRGVTTIGMNYSQVADAISKTDAHEFDFSYTHEEKISVPPLSRVKATITSYSVNYEQGHAILFSIPSTVCVPVYYRTSFQQALKKFGSFCQKTGSISVAQLCSTLPDFRNANGLTSFVQRGILSWIGEGSSIEKDIETL